MKLVFLFTAWVSSYMPVSAQGKFSFSPVHPRPGEQIIVYYEGTVLLTCFFYQTFLQIYSPCG